MPARYRVPFLTVASYVFYGTWSIPFIAVILITTAVDYFASHVIYKSTSPKRRKSALIVALAVNLLVLGFFKYFNFLLGTHSSILALLGIHNALPKHMDIILPLGISYYTFEAISYVVDVYRGNKPAPSWWQYN